MTIYWELPVGKGFKLILVDFNINAVVFRVIICSNYNFLKTGFCLNRKIQQRIGSYLQMNHKVIPKDLNLCVYVPIKLTKYFCVSVKLFVGGLSWQTEEHHLQTYFNQFGSIENVQIMKDPFTMVGISLSSSLSSLSLAL